MSEDLFLEESFKLADTALKIGLSALISGIATYKITNLNHNKTLSRERFNKRVELLESVSSDSLIFFNLTLRIFSKFEYVLNKRKSSDTSSLTKSELDYIRIPDDKGEHSNLSRNKASATLLLLGLNDEYELLEQINNELREFFGPIEVNLTLPDRPLFDKTLANTKKLRKNYFDLLSKSYKNIEI